MKLHTSLLHNNNHSPFLPPSINLYSFVLSHGSALISLGSPLRNFTLCVRVSEQVTLQVFRASLDRRLRLQMSLTSSQFGGKIIPEKSLHFKTIWVLAKKKNWGSCLGVCICKPLFPLGLCAYECPCALDYHQCTLSTWIYKRFWPKNLLRVTLYILFKQQLPRQTVDIIQCHTSKLKLVHKYMSVRNLLLKV